MNKITKLILILALFCFDITIYAQSGETITGRVIDEKGELLIGVTVKEVGTTNGIITDVNGVYTLKVTSKRSTLNFSYVGFDSQDILLGNSGNVIDVVMKESKTELDEVVVVGYGTQRRISTIGAQANVKLTDIKQPTASLSTSLVGRLAGIVAVQRTGEPGKDNADIWIRGISTMGNSNPLVLVDGVERSFNNIDPEDVESLTVLKDASATAVYGVRGANGVILIKTKPGISGKTSVSVDYYEGITRLTKIPKLASGTTYMQAVNEALRNGGNAPKYSETEILNTSLGTDPLLYPNVNWMDEVFNDIGHNRRANINVRGGGQTSNYYASVSYYDEQGLIKRDKSESYNSQIGYSRYNFTTNLNINVTPTTKLDVGASGYLGEGRSPHESTNVIFREAMTTSPVDLPVMFTINGKDYIPYTQPNSGFNNPYVGATKRGFKTVTNSQIYSNLRLTQDLKFITEGLNLSGMFAFDTYNSRTVDQGKAESTYYWADKSNPYDRYGNPILVQTYEGSKTLGYEVNSEGNRKSYLEASLNYSRAFGEHRVSALFLYNQEDKVETFKNTSIMQGLPYRSRGLAGRLTYSWNDKYFGEFNIGYNGSENFSPNKRYGTFPAFGIGWVPSNEAFWKPISNVVSFFKVRYTNGFIGNQATPKRFLYLESLEYSGGRGYTWGNDRREVDGYNVLNEAVDVTWERSHKQDLGFDIKLLKDDISIVVDLYKERRKGIFLDRGAVPGFIGLTATPVGNLGIVDNKGLELDLEYNKKLGKDLFVTLRGNFTYSKNKVIENDQPEQMYPWMDKRGHNTLARWGLIADGLYTQDEINQINAWEALSDAEKANTSRPFPTQFGAVQAGDIKYRDLNGDGQIDTYDETKIGRGDVPAIVYGFGFNIQYKNFSVSTLFQGTAQADRCLTGLGIQPFSGSGGEGNLFSNITDRWSEDNPSQDVFYPRLAYGADKNENNFKTSTWWQKDVSFLRLKSLQITYRLPKKWTNSVLLNNASVYAMGTNLFTISDFKLWDPELNTNNGTLYPNISTYTIGINFNF
ncbi:TonB-dependent receptor [uncultured Dysgonomonas sp.]|uniref:SusC homolog n=1 Tax=uncultured Dysgonomonas sp. TaxID=206096 RepID=A0A212JVI3_9BACT|nr:TonB-dependent receptor [uncultured Dysgonomonas sp.]SBW03474.1 SusC homolog [uncultured Dysgonomonas sp.]